jgi:tripartite-type tricarboxylate transporter receptor subunit TctC
MRFLNRLAVAALALASAHAAAQNWPAKPIRVYTSAPGGPYDTVMRGLGVPLGQNLGQPIVVENRSGGNYVPLGRECARAAPDGYVLCTADVYIISFNPHAFATPPYQLKDFTPIIHWGHLPAAVIVHPSVPANSLQELLALAKAKPGAITFGTPGPATNSSMYVEYFQKNMGVNFLNVPYKNFVSSLQAVITGEVNVAIFGLGMSLTQAKAGKVKPLAITGEQRSQFAPHIPTIMESGVDMNIANWGGMVGPAGLPRDIVLRLNGEVRKLISDPVLKQKYLDAQTFEQQPPAGGTPEQFAAFLQAEDRKFERLAKTIGLRIE